MAAAIARLLASASLPPRSTTALPVLMQMAATSLVTFGRDSYTTPTTPSGTRRFEIARPFGRVDHVELLADRDLPARATASTSRAIAGDALGRQSQAIDLDPR